MKDVVESLIKSMLIIYVQMPTAAKDTIATLGNEVELRSVALASPLNRTMIREDNSKYTEEMVETTQGMGVTRKMLVAWTGDRRKPAIVTYHDLGLNYISNFQV